MSTPRPTLTDALLKGSLSGRADGPHTTADLLDDVLTAVATRPHAARWSLPHAARWRLVPVVLVVVIGLVALIGAVLVAGARHQTPVTGAGEIAFVQATYTCGDKPCLLSMPIAGLRAEGPRIVGISSAGGAPTKLIDIPGAGQRMPGWSLSDPRSFWLAGPAVRWSPDGRRLAFRLFNDVPGIYLVDRDGGGLTRLVDLPDDAFTGMASSPALAWSPDGTQIAYTYPYGGVKSPLYVVDTLDGRVRALDVQASRTLAWSPDGTKIAFARSGPPGGRFITSLNVIGADGNGETRLTAAEAWNYHVNSIAWSPDGSRIAFTLAGDSRSLDPNRTGVYTIKPDGSGLRMLTEPGGPVDHRGGCCIHLSEDEPLEWSPDGSRLAALWPAYDTGTGIVVANADESGALALGPLSAYDIGWSPDGTRIVYAAGQPWTSGWDRPMEVSTEDWSSIFIINADGSGNRWLADGEYPDWSSSVVR